MEKRGLWLAEHVGDIILAVVCLVLLWRFGLPIVDTLLFGKQENLQAQAQLDDLVLTLEQLKPDAEESYPLFVPKGWFLVSFSKGERGPAACFLRSCICICEKRGGFVGIGSKVNCDKGGVCEIITKDAKLEPKEIKIPMALLLKSNSFFTIKAKEKIVYEPYKLSDIDLDKLLKEKYPAFGEFGLGKCIKDVEKDTKVPASVILAVALHESEKGKNEFARKTNNLFNMKGAGPDGFALVNVWECLKEEETSRSDVVSCEESELCGCRAPPNEECKDKHYCRVWSKFRKYKDKCQSVRGFAEMIAYGRYSESMKYKDNLEEMILAIFRGGYATDPLWADKVMAYIQAIQEIA